MQKKLLRSPGRTITARFEMIAPSTGSPKTHHLPKKADPNGYYESLGLDTSRDWSDEEVKRAYWVKAKKYHPDGSSPDTSEFRRVQVAYSVLRDPDSRAKYDALEPSQQWLDENVIAAIVKNVVGLKDREAAIEAIKEGLGSPVPAGVPPPPRAPQFDDFAYYYYEGEEPPPRPTRHAWVEEAVRAMLARGYSGDVRLGFTEGEPHVVSKPWGRVLMVSGDPSIETISNMV